MITKRFKRLTYEEVQLFFTSLNCKLLSTDYQGTNHKLEYVCHCGRNGCTRFSDFRYSKQCKKCGNEKGGKSGRIDEKIIYDKIKASGYTLISGIYTGAYSKLTLMCPNGHIKSMLWNDFKRRHVQQNKSCLKCLTGEKSPHWKNRTQEELNRRKRSELKNWRKNIIDRDNCICQKCLNSYSYKELCAHHLNGYHWDIEHRGHIDNGITLCSMCHNEFHVIYGRRYNTIFQYNEWNRDKAIINLNLEVVCKVLNH